MAYLALNGYELPSPKRGVEPLVTTIVDAGRDANGVVVGQRIGRDQYKLNNLEWSWLDAETWSRILSILSGFFVYATFPDPVTNELITLKMYPGDRSAEPYYLDDSGKPTHYRNCRFNLIDTGE